MKSLLISLAVGAALLWLVSRRKATVANNPLYSGEVSGSSGTLPPQPRFALRSAGIPALPPTT